MGIKCPECNSDEKTVKRGFKVIDNQKMQRVYCKECSRNFTVEAESESTINTDPKFACPQCNDINVFIKNTTSICNKMMQKCFCQKCNAYYLVEIPKNTPIDDKHEKIHYGIPEPSKFKCIKCDNPDVYIEDTTLDSGKLTHKCYCKNCGSYFSIVVEDKKFGKDSSYFDSPEFLYPSTKIFYCHSKTLGMAFPARIQANNSFHAIEKFANDICEKLKSDNHLLLSAINNMIVHVFDENNKLCAIYKSKDIKLEFDTENIYNVNINDI